MGDWNGLVYFQGRWQSPENTRRIMKAQGFSDAVINILCGSQPDQAGR